MQCSRWHATCNLATDRQHRNNVPCAAPRSDRTATVHAAARRMHMFGVDISTVAGKLKMIVFSSVGRHTCAEIESNHTRKAMPIGGQLSPGSIATPSVSEAQPSAGCCCCGLRAVHR